MAKAKIAGTGEGYLGETMVHRVSRAVGVVESVTVAQAGWPPEIILKLADGSIKKGKLSEFREASGNERKKLPPVESKPDEIAAPPPLVASKPGGDGAAKKSDKDGQVKSTLVRHSVHATADAPAQIGKPLYAAPAKANLSRRSLPAKAEAPRAKGK